MNFFLVIWIAAVIGNSELLAGQQITAGEASQILARASKWPPISYITPTEASTVFAFNGELEMSELIQVGDPNDISNILIKPKDGSFDHILLRIDDGGTYYNEVDMMAKSDGSNSGSSGAITPLALSNGSRGYLIPGESIVVQCPDRRFDISIEIAFYEDRGDPIVTESNRKLLDAILRSGDQGRAFLIAAISKIYPLAEEKYRNQIRARIEVAEAKDLLAAESAAAPMPAETVGASQPLVSGTQSVATSVIPRSPSSIVDAIVALLAIIGMVFIVIWRKNAR
jgi:hypothetical protein